MEELKIESPVPTPKPWPVDEKVLAALRNMWKREQSRTLEDYIRKQGC